MAELKHYDGNWKVVEFRDGTLQIVPEEQMEAHVMSLGCFCNPTAEAIEGHFTIVHNAFIIDYTDV